MIDDNALRIYFYAGAILQVNKALGMEDLVQKWKLEEGFVLNIYEL